MAFRRDRHPDMNLNEVDHSITWQICQNFDIDRSWEQLAGVIGYSTKHIQTFELETRRPDGSPTKKILWDWGTRGATVRDLHDKLNLINKQQSVRLLEPIMKIEKHKEVEKQSLSLVKEDNNSSSSSMMSNDDNLRVPTSPGMASSGRGCLPIPKKNKNMKGPVQMGDVNLNTFDGKLAKPSAKDKQKMLDMTGVGTSSMKIQEYHADGPASGPGNMGAAAASARSFERVKSAVEEYDSTHPPYMSQLSDSEQNMARALSSIPNYTYKELSQATGGFSERYVIGEGKFGKVFKGRVKNTDFAIKKLHQRPDMNLDNDTTTHLAAELQSLCRYRHDNIVSLYAYASDGDEICLLYQFMHNGSLEDCLHKNGGKLVLSWEQRLVILRGSACGLQFLHSVDPKPVIHGDIKSSNILLDRHFEAKIGDLGMAQKATGGEVTGKYTHITKKTTGVQDYKTRAYLAPEMSRGGSSSLKGDTFAFGVVLFECLTGQQAYDDRREGSVDEKNLVVYIENYVEDHPKCNRQKKFQDQKLDEDYPANVFTALFEMAEKCTKQKKKDRPSMVEVYKMIETAEGSQPDVDYCNIKGSKMAFGMEKADPYLQKQTSNDENNPNGFDPPPLKTNTPMSPVDLLPHDQLPESVKLQMEVDKRREMAGESNYVNVNKLKDVQDIFKSDPKKLAEIEKSDRAFIQGSMHRVEGEKQSGQKQLEGQKPLEGQQQLKGQKLLEGQKQLGGQNAKPTFDIIDTNKEVYYVNTSEVEVVEVSNDKANGPPFDAWEGDLQNIDKVEKMNGDINSVDKTVMPESHDYINVPVEIAESHEVQVLDVVIVQGEQDISAFHQKPRNCSLEQAAVTGFLLKSDKVLDVVGVQRPQDMFHDYDAELDEIRTKAVKPNSSMMDIFKRFDDAKEEEFDDSEFVEQYGDEYDIHFDFEGSEGSDCSTLKLSQSDSERADSFHLSGVTDEDLFGGGMEHSNTSNIYTPAEQVEHKIQQINIGGGRNAGENEDTCSLNTDNNDGEMNDIDETNESIDTSLQRHKLKQAQYCNILHDIDKKREGDLMVDNLIHVAGNALNQDCAKIDNIDRNDAEKGQKVTQDCMKIENITKKGLKIGSGVKGPPNMYEGIKVSPVDPTKGSRVPSESVYV